MSTFFGLEIGSRALQANQTAVDVTGNNIANASTEGYSRQRVTLTATQPYTIPAFNSPTSAGQLGTGVTVDQIQRLRDSFSDLMLRNQVKDQGLWDAKGDVLNKIQGLVAEPSGSGLSDVLQQFYAAWQGVSQDPSPENRSVVLESTNGLMDFLHNFSAQLGELNQDVNSTLTAKIGEMNTIAGEIADLNSQISNVELGHQVTAPGGSTTIVRQNNANDLRDKRDLLLDQLAAYGDMKISEDAVSGMVSVTAGPSNQPLVSGATASPIPTYTDVQGNVYLGTNSSNPIDLGNGAISGYLNGRDQSLKNVQGALDQFTQELVKQVNYIHTQGADVNGVQGGNFFDPAGTTAATIALNPNITADKIAAGTFTPDPGNPPSPPNGIPPASGDGSQALKISDLQTALDPAAGGPLPAGETLESFWQTTIFNLGTDGKQANDQSANHELMVKQLDTQRQQTSGVSMDEEMTNMMKYQHGYNAASRLITVMDQMIDTIINKMGILG